MSAWLQVGKSCEEFPGLLSCRKGEEGARVCPIQGRIPRFCRAFLTLSCEGQTTVCDKPYLPPVVLGTKGEGCPDLGVLIADFLK